MVNRRSCHYGNEIRFKNRLQKSTTTQNYEPVTRLTTQQCQIQFTFAGHLHTRTTRLRATKQHNQKGQTDLAFELGGREEAKQRERQHGRQPAPQRRRRHRPVASNRSVSVGPVMGFRICLLPLVDESRTELTNERCKIGKQLFASAPLSNVLKSYSGANPRASVAEFHRYENVTRSMT